MVNASPGHARRNQEPSDLTEQRQKRAQYISGVASTTGARGTARIKLHQKKLELVAGQTRGNRQSGTKGKAHLKNGVSTSSVAKTWAAFAKTSVSCTRRTGA